MTQEHEKTVHVVLVSPDGKPIGLKEKYETHKNPVPLHSAISIIILSEDKTKMLLTQRAREKPTWPLFWSNAVCTHPYLGESYQDASERRLSEEMGFTTSLEEVLRFTYEAQYDEIWGEHEYDVVFVGTYDGNMTPNPDEIADCKWVNIDCLKVDVRRNPNIYTPWFKIILEKLPIS